jgi:hypothetical protein
MADDEILKGLDTGAGYISEKNIRIFQMFD